MDAANGPICKTCYKSLPSNFLGFDICPMCLYLSRQKASTHRARVPSYRSPLASLQEGTDRADNDG